MVIESYRDQARETYDGNGKQAGNASGITIENTDNPPIQRRDGGVLDVPDASAMAAVGVRLRNDC